MACEGAGGSLIASGEFFPHMLDNLPAAWFTFKRFGDGLAELVKP
jgi:hypothetical protein